MCIRDRFQNLQKTDLNFEKCTLFRMVVIIDHCKKKLSETFSFFLTEGTGDVVWEEQFLLCDWLDKIVLTGIIQIKIK